MIRNLADRVTEDIYNGTNSRHARRIPKELHDKIRRLLDQLNAVTKIEMLRVPPSNNLEKLKGNLSRYWSLRINKQWRIIFKWDIDNAYDVKIVDYH
jgi:proteic killer suppression protein